MKTIISMATAAVGIGLLGMWGASAGPANGVAIEKAIITLQDTQQVRARRARRYVRPARPWDCSPAMSPGLGSARCGVAEINALRRDRPSTTQIRCGSCDCLGYPTTLAASAAVGPEIVIR